MNQSLKVLITGAGTATTQSVIKGLRLQDELAVEIHTADMSPDNAGRYMSDAFHQIPAAASPDFLPRLYHICTTHQIDLLIPIVDYEFDIIAANKARFAERGTTAVISDPNTILRCNDKWETYLFFKELGIKTPQTWRGAEVDPSTARWPLFIKPGLMGRGSIDVYRVDDASQLARYLKEIPGAIVQEYVTGPEYTVDLLCGLDGRPLNGLVRQRIETKAGLSYKGITLHKPEILALAKKAAEALGAVGHINMQCFETADGISFFEINPRYSGTLTLSIAAGFNSPLSLLKNYLGHPQEQAFGTYQVGVTMYRYWQEIFVDAQGQQLPTHPVEGPTA